MDDMQSLADQHTIRLAMTMAIMQARKMNPSERADYLTRQVFSGPHGGRARFSKESVEFITDQLNVVPQK